MEVSGSKIVNEVKNTSMGELMKKLLLNALALGVFFCVSINAKAAGYSEVGEYGRPFVYVTEDTEEQIQEEIKLGEMELLAQLVEAEAGNQPFEGKCLVVDVVLNRVESSEWPNTIEEVIFQPGQFSVITDGAWDKAAWNMQPSDYAAVETEMELHSNKEVIYFNNCKAVAGDGTPFKVGDHWFND